jgi:predicted NBD/HSP70 family sugar kinase
MTAAQAAAAALGATGWPAAELLLAIRTGMAAGVAADRAATRTDIATGGRTGNGLHGL